MSTNPYVEDNEALARSLRVYFQTMFDDDTVVTHRPKGQAHNYQTQNSFAYFKENKVSISSILEVDGIYFWALAGHQDPGVLGLIMPRFNSGRSGFDQDINGLSKTLKPGGITRHLLCYEENLFYYALLPADHTAMTLDELIERTNFEMMHCYAGVGRPGVLIPANPGICDSLRDRLESFTVCFEP